MFWKLSAGFGSTCPLPPQGFYPKRQYEGVSDRTLLGSFDTNSSETSLSETVKCFGWIAVESCIRNKSFSAFVSNSSPHNSNEILSETPSLLFQINLFRRSCSLNTYANNHTAEEGGYFLILFEFVRTHTISKNRHMRSGP